MLDSVIDSDGDTVRVGSDMPAFSLVDSHVAPGQQEANSETVAAEGGQCAGNEAFQSYIDKVARNAYDPQILGDLDTLKAEHSCIGSLPEAMATADQLMKSEKDAYFDFLTPEEASLLIASVEGSHFSTGAVAGPPDGVMDPQRKGELVVYAVPDDSPAGRAGLQRGDVITHVDGQDLDEVPLEQAFQKLFPPEQRALKLEILRNGSPETLEIPTEPIDFPAVSDKTLPGGFAYIKINTFMQEDTAEELRAALEKHEDAPGIFIDVRQNQGGLLDQSLEAAQSFIDQGVVFSEHRRVESDPSNPEFETVLYNLDATGLNVLTRTDDSGSETTEKQSRQPDIVDKPVIILTDGGTASGAELFTAALQENEDAIVLGRRTVGKAVGQNVFTELAGDAAVKVTGLKYFTPSGKWLGDGASNRIGITPDMELPEPTSPYTPGGRDDQDLLLAYMLMSSLVRARQQGQ